METLVSLVVVSLGLVLGAEKLKPISWSEWAGAIEREGGARNPYRRLEERYSFWDVRVGSNYTISCYVLRYFNWGGCFELTGLV